MFCLRSSQSDKSLLRALSLEPVSSQQMLQHRASCLFYLCRSDVINIRFARLRLLRNTTVGQIRCTLLLNPQLYCKTASPGSNQSSLLLSGYKVSAWIKGIASPLLPLLSRCGLYFLPAHWRGKSSVPSVYLPAGISRQQGHSSQPWLLYLGLRSLNLFSR